MEIFYNLKEIMSLDKSILKLLEDIDVEKGRITRANSLRDSKLNLRIELYNESKNLDEAIKKIDSDLEQIFKRIDFLKSQIPNILNEIMFKAHQNEMVELKNKQQNLEEDYLAKLADREVKEEQLREVDNFLDGLQVSFEEICREVEQINLPRLKDIQEKNLRKNYLINALPPEVDRKLKRFQALHPQKVCFTWDQKGYCFQCRTHLTSLLQIQIEQAESVHTCQGCGRLFLPLKVMENR